METKKTPDKAMTSAILEAGKKVVSNDRKTMVQTYDEEKIGFALCNARNLIRKYLKGRKEADITAFALKSEKEIFVIEDYFYQLHILKLKEYENSKKQLELPLS